ncbi:MFS general substrate transporter [Choiromyces venosus 120613-1]|uniref:MFS general substrate transporter n=1 Tax=Choiromyces venosus 120613-1 TaxID=1336337 RepID=A0A3N4K234_9PEZI|nr:MFS general substrate transporter [Choiromyces venosus 120613-1]
MEGTQTRRSSIAEKITESDSPINSSDPSSASDHSNESEGYSSPATRVVTNKSCIVPRSKRRGMFGQLALVPEIEDPRDYGRFIKYLITILVAAAGSTAPMASTILLPALSEVAVTLHSTQVVANLSVALYMLSLAMFPLWWSSISERKGRRAVYIISFFLFTISTVCCAISTNISMLVVFRIASGGAASSAQAVGAGTIADIWQVSERGKAMGWFYLGPLCGPLLGPILGGILTEEFGWKGTQWFLAFFGLVLFFGMLFCLPETLRIQDKPKDKPMELPDPSGDNLCAKEDETTQPPGLQRTITRASRRTLKKSKQWAKTTKIVLVDPLKSLLYLRFPPVLLTVIYASMTFGILYVLNVSLQTAYSHQPYSYSPLIVGLLFIPGSLGYITASLTGGRWSDSIMRRAAVKRRAAAGGDESTPLEYRPEDRIGINSWIAGIMFPCALICYGWIIEQGYYWAAPLPFTFTFGFGSMLVFGMTTTMLTEFVPGRASSAVAVNNFVRNILSCIGSALTEPIINAIGNGWLFTIIGILGLISLSVIWAMHRYGPKWRAEAHKYSFM